MSLKCGQLKHVRQILRNGHWPAAASAEVQEHVLVCQRCSQEVLVTTHLQHARSHALAAMQSGSASLLWWRAQARRRHSALARVARPVLAGQVFALVVLLITVGGLAVRYWNVVLDRAMAAPPSISSIVEVWGVTPLIVGAALISTLGAIAVYLTTERL